ncbi:hypothetical protein IAU60_001078 [Kwoniella sp. DSM 27419]
MALLGSGSSSNEAPVAATKPAVPDTSEKAVNPLNPKGLKPCCACPETKSARDECFLRSNPGEGEEACKALIEAHKACMRGYGFKV